MHPLLQAYLTLQIILHAGFALWLILGPKG